MTTLAIAIPAAATVALGVVPGPLLNLAQDAATFIR
jgi:hypothetical protein